MKFNVTIEGLALTLGTFAAYFALYESYIMCFKQPSSLDDELGAYYEWIIRNYRLEYFVPTKDVSTTSEKAQFIAVLQAAAALSVILSRNKLFGLVFLSLFYQVAVRGHTQLQTPYVPVAFTMFGFSHVALLAKMLEEYLPSSEEEATGAVEAGEGETQEEEEEAALTESKKSRKKKPKSS